MSGATYTSVAVIGAVKRGLQYAQSIDVEDVPSYTVLFSAKFICGVIVVLMAAIVPLFIRSPRYRLIQMLLNVVILGFWCGTFLSYLLLVNYVSNGIRIWSSILPLLMLNIIFAYPDRKSTRLNSSHL